MASRPRRSTAAERYLPLGYFGAALLLVVVLLPTVLRPPQQPPTQTAELSPDAPPDDEQQSIIATLNRAASGTAGSGEGVGPADTVVDAVAAPVTKPRPSRCTGPAGPPRLQVNSPYSPPCVPAFTGDNGGATADHVSAHELHIGIAIPDYDSAPKGPVTDDGTANTMRWNRTWQTYVNRRFETYGRLIRFYNIKISLNDEAQARAAIQEADEAYDLFAIVAGETGTFHANVAAADEAVRRGIIVYGVSHGAQHYYRERHPYYYGFLIPADTGVSLMSELICKQLAGKPPSYNERRDATFDYSQPRRFGIILYQDINTVGIDGQYREQLGACGVTPTIVQYNVRDNPSQIAAAVTRLRAAGATTVVCQCDLIAPISYTNEANSQGYYPEWLSPNMGGMENAASSRNYSADQWRHSLGIYPQEIPRAAQDLEWYRAYREMAPDDPTPGPGNGLFRDLVQTIGAIQMAGPKLTPQSFWQGLLSFPVRPPEPKWAVAGGYGPGDFAYTDYVALTWWDPTATDPVDGVTAGTFRFVNGGQRYKMGEIPMEPQPFFESGITTP